MIEQGMMPSQVASLLGIHEDTVKSVISRAGGAAGKVLGNQKQKEMDDLLEEDPELCCPVSLMLFVDPVIASDGFMYEKASLDGLLRCNMASPMTRERLKKEYLPARQRKSAAIEFRQTRGRALTRFAKGVAVELPHLATAALERASDYMDVLTPQAHPDFAKDLADAWRQLGTTLPASLAGY